MKHVFVAFELTYDSDEVFRSALATGVLGVFENQEDAVKLMRQQMIKIGMPNEDYRDEMMFAIPVDEDGHWVDAVHHPNDVRFWMEFDCKEVELNKSICNILDH